MLSSLSDNLWKEVRCKRNATLAKKWQACTASTYYTVNQILLLCIGLWPYQKSSFRHILIPFITIILVTCVVFQFTIFITTEYNVDLLLQVSQYSLPWLCYMIKYNILCLNIKKMRGLMERVRFDWNGLSNVQEIEIIKKYSATGRFITLICALFIYSTVFGFALILFLSNFLLMGNAATANESCPRQLPALVEYFVDHQKYFYPILLHLFLAVLFGLTTAVATETLYMSYTQHACGLFQIASNRVEQALQGTIVQDVASERNSIVQQGIISGINMYRRAIEFIEMSKANFKWSYIFLLPLGVLSLTVNLYRLSRLLITKEYEEIIISVMLVIGHFLYMFFCNYLGQEVINHSGNVFDRTYNTQWYVAPVRVQKILLFIMQRTIRHYTIVIGGLFISSLEGFATLTSMSISYFMVIHSIH